MNFATRGLVAAMAAAGVGFAADAQLIVGNDQSGTATIWHIDIGTGNATALYSASTSDAKPWGMAYDAATNTLYWNNGVTLFSSPFSMGGLTPTNLGPITFNGANQSMVSLAFRDGNLYGTKNIATEAVYEIDPATRVATQSYVYSSTFDFGGLDVDATDGEMYGLTDAPSTGRGLYQFDIPGQTETFRAPYFNGETDLDGLAVHDGIAYYISDGPNTTQANFYVVDIATGTQIGTLPSPFTGSGTFSAGAFIAPIPAPGALALLGLAGLASSRRRRN